MNILRSLAGQKCTLGIEFTNEFLKLMLIRGSQGKEEVLLLESIPTKDKPESEVLDKLFSIMKSIQVKKFDTILALPVSSAITKTIQIPSTEDNEIRDILNLQAGRQTPYSREELVVDYINLGQFQGVYTKVLVVMVTSEVIKKRMSTLQNAGIKISKIVFSSDGLGALAAAKLKKVTPSNASQVILSMDLESTDFNVFGDNGLLFARNIAIGVEQLKQDADKNLKKFVEEVGKSLEAYMAEDIQGAPETIYISKNGEVDTQIYADLSTDLGLDIKDFNLKDFLAVKEPYDKFTVDEKMPSFISLASTLIAVDALHIDLVPEDIKVQRKFEEKTRKIVMAGILFMVIFIQVCLIYMVQMYYKDQRLTALKKQFSEKINEAHELRSVSEKTRVVKSYLSDRLDMLNVVSRLYEVLPETMYIKGITIDKEDKIFVKGTSKSMSQIFAFVTELENEPLFMDVKTEYTESRKEGDEDVSEFGLVMTIER